MKPLYLDYNATTPVDPRVLEAMIPWFLEPSNAGSRTHVYGQRAKDAVEKARKQVADLLGAQPEEIIFTSGATESNNLAILGLAPYGEKTGRKHILSTAIEHKSVLEPLEYLRTRGFEVELAPVTRGGYVEPDEIEKRLRRDTLLVSVMHANNETGVIQPVEEISTLLTHREILFHVDAAQTFGKEVEPLRHLLCDYVSVSAHKVYGPKGVGALYCRRSACRRSQLAPLSLGGGQERGLRPGTVPVPLVVGFGRAACLASSEFSSRRESADKIKRQLLADLQAVPHQLNGDATRTQTHVVNVSFIAVDSEALMMALRNEYAISNGSACTSDSYQPSHVLKAMGLSDDLIESAVRLSWGPGVEPIPSRRLADTVKSLSL